MPEPLDLDALKAKWRPHYGWGPNPELTDLFTVIAELESTRAERDGWHLNADLCEQRLDEERARADRAEAERDGYAKQCLIHIAAAETAETLQANAAAYNTQLTHRAEKAEAAIARVRDFVANDRESYFGDLARRGVLAALDGTE